MPKRGTQLMLLAEPPRCTVGPRADLEPQRRFPDAPKCVTHLRGGGDLAATSSHGYTSAIRWR